LDESVDCRAECSSSSTVLAFFIESSSSHETRESVYSHRDEIAGLRERERPGSCSGHLPGRTSPARGTGGRKHVPASAENLEDSVVCVRNIYSTVLCELNSPTDRWIERMTAYEHAIRILSCSLAHSSSQFVACNLARTNKIDLGSIQHTQFNQFSAAFTKSAENYSGH
jgi:hypothetical protein